MHTARLSALLSTLAVLTIMIAAPALIAQPDDSPLSDRGWTELISHDSALNNWRNDQRGWSDVGTVAMSATNNEHLVAEQGEGILFNGPEGGASDVVSIGEWGDVELVAEYLLPRGSNSGVYLQGRYEVQVLDSWGKKQLTYGDHGGIYERWDDTKPDGEQGYEGTPPMVNASRKPGEWQRLELVFYAPRFDADGNKVSNARFEDVRLNGVLIHERAEVTGPTRGSMFGDEEAAAGPLRLQGDHGPIGYRSVRVRSIGEGSGGRLRAGRTLDEWAELLESSARVSRLMAANTIAHSGSEGKALMLGMMGHDDDAVRYWAARGLSMLSGSERRGPDVAGALTGGLGDDSYAVRMACGYGLRGTAVAGRGVEVLIGGLAEERQGFANVAADYLGWMGEEAEAALPALRKLSGASDYHLKNAADRAIVLIEGG